MTTEADGADLAVMNKARELFGHVAVLGGFETAVSELVAYVRAERLAAQPSAPSAEPVAYRYKSARGHWRYVGHPFTPGWGMPPNLEHEPLYAAPTAQQVQPAADLRQCAMWAVDAYNNGRPDYLLRSIQKLTRALDTAQPAPAEEAFEGRVIVGHSKERRGWFVYEETEPGEFFAFKGPFATQAEADAAMRDPSAPTIAPAPAAPQAAPRMDAYGGIADLRDAKWLDPECAHRGACQSLLFKSAPQAAQPQPLTDAEKEAGMRSFEWGSAPHPFRTSVAFERGVLFAEHHHGISAAAQAAPKEPQP